MSETQTDTQIDTDNVHNKQIPSGQNTRKLCKGKYHCTGDLLFDVFRFSIFALLKLSTNLLFLQHKQSSLIQTNTWG